MATTVENPFDTQQPSATNTGIVGSAMQTAAPTTGQMPSNVGTTAPATPNVATYAPTTRQISKPTDTVQGQVDSILAKDSPLMQRARTLATQNMAQRGLVNSSMAQGAGVAAMVDRATPIAAQDASAYNQVASENANALNQSGQFNAGEINRFGLQTSQQNFQGAQAGLDRAQQTNLQTGQQTFQAGQSSLDRSQQTNLQSLQQNFQASQTALDRALSNFQQDKSLASQQALQAAQQNFQGAQAQLERNQQSSLQVGQQQFQASQTQLQNDFTSKMQTLQESGMDFRQARDIASREATTRLEQMGITNRFDQELALKGSQFNIEQYNLERRQILQNQTELDKMGLQIKSQNAQIPTNFAANVSNTVMQGVSAVYGQPMDSSGKPTAAERAAQVQSLVNYANNQIAWGEKFYATTIPRISP